MTAGTIHFRVSGRVQGVFFRASCKQEADRLGITGWVRNLPDGSVEGMASADPAKLQAFRTWLKRGPKLASVAKLEVTEVAYREFARFEIQ